MTDLLILAMLSVLLVLDAIAIDAAYRRGYSAGYRVGFEIGLRQPRPAGQPA